MLRAFLVSEVWMLNERLLKVSISAVDRRVLRRLTELTDGAAADGAPFEIPLTQENPR
jgi:hypothetical protein